MLFSSISFLYYFLPVALVLYFAVPGRFKNTILLLVSLVFYAWGEPKYILLMLVSILVGFFAGILIGHCAGQSRAKQILILLLLSIKMVTSQEHINAHRQRKIGRILQLRILVGLMFLALK